MGIVIRFNNQAWIVEALEGKGVRFVPFTAWLKWNGEIEHWETAALSHENAWSIAFWCLSKTGSEYAGVNQFVRSFSLVWSRLRKLFGVKLDTDSKRFFCSELIAAALKINGQSITKPAPRMTPGDIAQLCYWRKTLN